MITKKIVLFGTNESLVGQVAKEAIKRGHSVTAIVPNPKALKLDNPKFNAFGSNAISKNEVSKYAKGQDVIICLYEPIAHHEKIHIETNIAIIEGAKSAGVQRIISLGHPVSLALENTKEFNDSWRHLTKAQKETLKLFKNEFWLRWGYLHSHNVCPEARSNRRYAGNEIFLSNPEGMNKIVHKNQFIDALLDEAEKTEYILEEDEIVL